MTTSPALSITPASAPWRRLADGLRIRLRTASARRKERLIRADLGALDDHLLRDMGFCRDQIAGLARAARDLPPDGWPRRSV